MFETMGVMYTTFHNGCGNPVLSKFDFWESTSRPRQVWLDGDRLAKILAKCGTPRGGRGEIRGSNDVKDACFYPLLVSPLGLWDPFQMAFLWLINGGDPNYLLTGMILQAKDGS